jgi:archaellum component FlaD/FlaE
MADKKASSRDLKVSVSDSTSGSEKDKKEKSKSKDKDKEKHKSSKEKEKSKEKSSSSSSKKSSSSKDKSEDSGSGKEEKPERTTSSRLSVFGLGSKGKSTTEAALSPLDALKDKERLKKEKRKSSQRMLGRKKSTKLEPMPASDEVDRQFNAIMVCFSIKFMCADFFPPQNSHGQGQL